MGTDTQFVSARDVPKHGCFVKLSTRAEASAQRQHIPFRPKTRTCRMRPPLEAATEAFHVNDCKSMAKQLAVRRQHMQLVLHSRQKRFVESPCCLEWLRTKTGGLPESTPQTRLLGLVWTSQRSFHQGRKEPGVLSLTALGLQNCVKRDNRHDLAAPKRRAQARVCDLPVQGHQGGVAAFVSVCMGGAGVEVRLSGAVRAAGAGAQLEGGPPCLLETCRSHRAVAG